MRVAAVSDGKRDWIGLVDPTGTYVKEIEVSGSGHRDPVIDFLSSSIDGLAYRTTGGDVPLESLQILPPIRWPSKNVICVGKNYRDHAAEFAGSGYDASSGNDTEAVPDEPILFSKAACCLAGAHDDVQVPWSLSSEIDYEAELGVVIGRGGRAISKADAMGHVWGYTVINDVTARDLQSRHKQWLLGKSIDTFCPTGPWIVSADELDPANLHLSCWVNDELRQSASTGDLIFDIPTIIATVSASMTLETGDIIATGTPAGVGIGFQPPRFLKSGDTVKVEISGIGAIINRIV